MRTLTLLMAADGVLVGWSFTVARGSGWVVGLPVPILAVGLPVIGTVGRAGGWESGMVLLPMAEGGAGRGGPAEGGAPGMTGRGGGASGTVGATGRGAGGVGAVGAAGIGAVAATGGGGGGVSPRGPEGRSVMRTVSFFRGTAEVLMVGRGGVGRAYDRPGRFRGRRLEHEARRRRWTNSRRLW